MGATIVLTAVIGLYAAWVIRRKIKDAKRGKFCSCGCQGCTGSCPASVPEKKEKE